MNLLQNQSEKLLQQHEQASLLPHILPATTIDHSTQLHQHDLTNNDYVPLLFALPQHTTPQTFLLPCMHHVLSMTPFNEDLILLIAWSQNCPHINQNRTPANRFQGCWHINLHHLNSAPIQSMEIYLFIITHCQICLHSNLIPTPAFPHLWFNSHPDLKRRPPQFNCH